MFEKAVSLGLEFGNNFFEFPCHELVVDDEGESSAFLVVADGAGNQSLMLLLDSDVIMDEHLHVESVVALLLQPLEHAFVLAFLELRLDVSLNFLHKHPCLSNLLQRLLMLLHFAQNSSLVEVGWDDIILLLIFEIFNQVLLEIDSIADSLECHHVVLIFLEDAC